MSLYFTNGDVLCREIAEREIISSNLRKLKIQAFRLLCLILTIKKFNEYSWFISRFIYCCHFFKFRTHPCASLLPPHFPDVCSQIKSDLVLLSAELSSFFFCKHIAPHMQKECSLSSNYTPPPHPTFTNLVTRKFTVLQSEVERVLRKMAEQPRLHDEQQRQ